jgi:hypothetical protein
MPINLVAEGSENALGFSINFDSTLLTFSAVALGSNAAGASLIYNTNQLANGHLGLAISLPSNSSFPAGTQEVAEVRFSAAPLTNNTLTGVSFGDQPISREIVNSSAVVLAANYIGGNVTIPFLGFEGDVSPLPNGDGRVTIADWVQVGRFVAGLDTITNAGEYQRADCAPRSTLGNGAITITDWVQAGRYAAGLDPLTPAGGPTQDQGGGFGAMKASPGSTSRTVAVGNSTVQSGQICQVPVILNSQGNENALGFSLKFNQAILTFSGATLGAGATGATLNVNTNQAAAGGDLGVALALPAGSSFAAGSQEVARLTFLVSTSATGGTNIALVKLSPANGSLNLSWPVAALGFGLESSDSLSPPNWTPVTATLVTNANDVTISIPLSGAQKFYRLHHP